MGTGWSTRDACSGWASLTDARLGGGLMWLASSSYKSVARPALTVNNYDDLDIIRMKREGVEKAGVKDLRMSLNEAGRGGGSQLEQGAGFPSASGLCRR